MLIRNHCVLCLVTVFLGKSYVGMAGERLSERIHAIQDEIQSSEVAYEDLRELTTEIGPRLSGSEGADRAVDWAVHKLQSYGVDRVWKQPVEVPRWERGDVERAEVLGLGEPIVLQIAALGRSAGTAGTEAQVIEVQSLAEVRELGDKVKGKIVFYNRPMPADYDDPFEAYGQTVDQRTSGPHTAARLGAVAVLVRSVMPRTDDPYPHTGATYFPQGVEPIPAAALSTRDANLLSNLLKKNPKLKVKVELSARTLPNVISHNVVAEIKGSEISEEIVLVGGHMDSWDLGQGAHDDGTGVVQSIDVCRAIVKLNLRPRRTVRCVLYMTEELGGIGGDEYARVAGEAKENHVMAVESDRGGFAPKRFSVSGTPEQIAELQASVGLFSATGIESFAEGEAGVDVAPLAEHGALTMELVPDGSRYFDFHHAATDRFEAVDANEFRAGGAALASLVYYFADR